MGPTYTEGFRHPVTRSWRDNHDSVQEPSQYLIPSVYSTYGSFHTPPSTALLSLPPISTLCSQVVFPSVTASNLRSHSRLPSLRLPWPAPTSTEPTVIRPTNSHIATSPRGLIVSKKIGSHEWGGSKHYDDQELSRDGLNLAAPQTARLSIQSLCDNLQADTIPTLTCVPDPKFKEKQPPGSKSFGCDNCKRVFRRNYELTRHKKRFSLTQQKFRCDWSKCQKQFRSDHLREHYRDYHMEDLPGRRKESSQQELPEWLGSRKINRWWRCTSCLHRNKNCWNCTECRRPCEEFRRKLRGDST